MIESVFHLLKIHRKMIFGNSSVIVQDMLGKTPKTFNIVNVIFGFLVDHIFRMINLVMLAPTFQRVVASKLVCKIDRTLSGLLPDNLHEFIGRDSFHNPRVNPPIALQKAKNNAFALGSTPALSFASAAKVALIHLNLARQFSPFQFRRVVDCLAQVLVDASNRLIIEAEIACQAIRRLRLVETFQDIQFSLQLLKRFLFSTGLFPATHIPASCTPSFERTTENALFTSQKVGRATENVLLSCNHKDILAPRGYVSH